MGNAIYFDNPFIFLHGPILPCNKSCFETLGAPWIHTSSRWHQFL
jgi:hypothetical protein